MTSGRFQTSGENENDQTSSSESMTSSTSTGVTPCGSSSDGGDIGVGGQSEHIRKFVFTGLSKINSLQRQRIGEADSTIVDKLEIEIPELLRRGYSFYTWRCAPILAWFLWERRNSLVGKRILELGSGTALPGILAAKCGADVILSDSCILPKSLAHIRKSCLANNLVPGEDIKIIGLSWGLLLNSVYNIGDLDLIIASDCFYDPSVFEDIIVTISFLLERNPQAKFIFTYQERSADWSIEALLKKWQLAAYQVNIDDIGKNSGVDILELMGGHTIHLIEVTKDL